MFAYDVTKVCAATEEMVSSSSVTVGRVYCLVVPIRCWYATIGDKCLRKENSQSTTSVSLDALVGDGMAVVTNNELVSQLVCALSPVNHKGLHQGWTTQTSVTKPPEREPQLTQEKVGKGFGKNAGEWTNWVEITMKKSLAVSVACMAIYWPTPGFNGRTFKLCVLSRWDFNFFVRSSPLRVSFNAAARESPSEMKKTSKTIAILRRDPTTARDCEDGKEGGRGAGKEEAGILSWRELRYRRYMPPGSLSLGIHDTFDTVTVVRISSC